MTTNNLHSPQEPQRGRTSTRTRLDEIIELAEYIRERSHLTKVQDYVLLSNLAVACRDAFPTLDEVTEDLYLNAIVQALRPLLAEAPIDAPEGDEAGGV